MDLDVSSSVNGLVSTGPVYLENDKRFTPVWAAAV